MLVEDQLPRRASITQADDARAMVDDVIGRLTSLAHVVAEETALMREGKIADALSREPRKK